jgi:glyoxylase-like metal-dependent hydrolase (beta-lactamase superfamily II)
MLRPIDDHIYELFTPFLGLPLSLYVLTGSQTVLIDSGISTTPTEYIFPAFEAAGLIPDLLICTHGHVDHFGGNAALRERYPHMKIAIHESDAAWAEDHVRHLHEMYMCMPQTWQYADGGREFLEQCGANSAVDIQLRDDSVIDLGTFQFRIVHTSGHSPGHIMLLDANRHLVICGDCALGWGAITPGAPLISPYYYDVDAYTHGIETARSLAGEICCTGHARVLDSSSMANLCQRSLDLVHSCDQWSLEALDSLEPRSLKTITATVGTHLPDYEIGFHLTASTQAHLQRHCRDSRARTLMINDLKHYLLA